MYCIKMRASLKQRDLLPDESIGSIGQTQTFQTRILAEEKLQKLYGKNEIF